MPSMVTTLLLARLELTVSDLARAEQFYVGAFGFEVHDRDEAEPAMAALYGVDRIRQVTLSRGGQTLCLQAFQPEGAAYPSGATACDQVFQHFALPVADMAAAYAKLAAFSVASISSAGPQQLPQSSGGSIAFKFRDPDGHPLELIQFPQPGGTGIDHSAIAVTDVDRSIAFYRDQLGFEIAARQLNTGVEQNQLDGLMDTRVDVVALQPKQATPHVELLAYHSPRGRPTAPHAANDIAATRLVLEVSGLPDPALTLADGTRAALLRDPDHHLLVLLDRLR
jgi:catechol 2,3-dioxygenase-like lactoylglutathione lyase family enzyme